MKKIIVLVRYPKWKAERDANDPRLLYQQLVVEYNALYDKFMVDIDVNNLEKYKQLDSVFKFTDVIAKRDTTGRFDFGNHCAPKCYHAIMIWMYLCGRYASSSADHLRIIMPNRYIDVIGISLSKMELSYTVMDATVMEQNADVTGLKELLELMVSIRYAHAGGQWKTM